MNAARLSVMLVGFGLVLMAVLVAYYQTDLRNQIPEGIAVAILLLLLGLIVIAVSSELRRTHVVGTHGPVVERIEREHVVHEPRYDSMRDPSVERVDRERVYRR